MSDESARVKKWKQANPDKVREQRRRYYLKNREKRLKYIREYKRRIRAQEKADTGGAEE